MRSIVDHIGYAPLDRNTHMSLNESRKRLAELAPEMDHEAIDAICVVRNPWDWYVSRYFFRQQRDASQDGERVPADHCGEGSEGFRRHMLLLKEHIDNGTPVLNSDGEPARTRTYVPLTLSGWHYRIVGEGKPVYTGTTAVAPKSGGVLYGRFENFEHDVPDMLQKTAGWPHIRTHAIVTRWGKVNASRHTRYREYYDDELRNLVADWDQRYINEFGYEF